jgi:uncharacterized damage-inducible protein DinB
MSDPSTWQATARYNRWFNTRLYETLAASTEEIRRASRGAFFGSIHGTLSHLVVADALWLTRVNALESADHEAPRWPGPAAQSLQLDSDVWPDFADLTRARAFLDARLVAWTEAFSADALQATVRYTNIAGTPFVHPLWWVAAHVFNHQAHHRGQATALMSQAGLDFGVTDLMVFLREDAARARA